MIIKDQKLIIEKANEISNKLLISSSDLSQEVFCDDDPSENIYLIVHVISSLLAKTCLSLEEHGKTYDIKDFTRIKAKEWIDRVADEYLDHYKGIFDEKR